MSVKLDPFFPEIPEQMDRPVRWGGLYGDAVPLVLASTAEKQDRLILVATPDTPTAAQLENELGYFLQDPDYPVLHFPDWETLAYDIFSPHQDIVSQRLLTLHRLTHLKRGILIVPVATLMQKILPREYLLAHSLVMTCGESMDLDASRKQFEELGYQCVSQVMEHGEFAVRGSIIDLFPMGSEQPYRIDLFDDEIDSIRYFDPESQRSLESLNEIQLLPAREFPFDDKAISQFRQAYRACFEGDPQRSIIYRDISQGSVPSGIEYYLPLFFEQTQTLFDYLDESTLIIGIDEHQMAAEGFLQQVGERYEQRRYDIERPLLAPDNLYLRIEELNQLLNRHQRIEIQRHKVEKTGKGAKANFSTTNPPPLLIQARTASPAQALEDFLLGFDGKVLFAAESAGRREYLIDLLKGFGISPKPVTDWHEFVESDHQLAITESALQRGLVLTESGYAVIAESQLFGARAIQARRRKGRQRDADSIIRDLSELQPDAPVVHEEHGVGRYRGLQVLDIGDIQTEFLTLEYAGNDKLYVPVSSLQLISRYTGASPENAPLHRLGSDRWQRAKSKAAKQARDVAAELLDLYARRSARQGHSFELAHDEYSAFASGFPFEETPDQEASIAAVVDDMTSGTPMDRVICGDVGFGKTEVAMRAAFIAVQGGRQVAVLVPTTLLAQQHFQNFQDRFADWPIGVELMSRFRTGKEMNAVVDGLKSGKIDIVIGTHKILQNDVKFKNLGLVVIDEEHRFGVRQKERFKQLRTEVDILTLTATPIPRTLNMAMAGLRSLSIISTPPARRLTIKTFVNQWNDALATEACLREINRGGQIYFLHNEVESIERKAQELQELLPGARIEVAHGQMRERELERVMLDFYHHRFNILVCTTIIESGIDVPNANTIIINRADRLGLAQLHQIRGRVGRSHHRAYAYLIVPPRKTMTRDAIKRLEAIESLEDLGAGFMLATHDLEIRGTGELLGEEQSGQIQEIGFGMYTELLERAVSALKNGKEPDFDAPLEHGPEVDLRSAALIPDEYLPDVHMRLTMYKRISAAEDRARLRELQVEMIDRFGLLPEALKALFLITELKIAATPLGIKKIEAHAEGGQIRFGANPDIDPVSIITMIQQEPRRYKLDGQEKLRFTMDLPDLESRVAAAKQILNRIEKPQNA